MSAIGGKADMALCVNPLLRSLLGAKRTCLFALQMSAIDPKRTYRDLCFAGARSGTVAGVARRSAGARSGSIAGVAWRSAGARSGSIAGVARRSAGARSGTVVGVARWSAGTRSGNVAGVAR